MDHPSAASSKPGRSSDNFAPLAPRHAACTIVSPNYLALARALAASYLAQHAGHRFFVLIVADAIDPDAFNASSDPFTTVLLPQLGIPDLRSVAMKYDILELNTNVKPTFLKYLLTAFSLEKLVYLDPDIFVYAPLTPVFAALDTHIAVLTPHITSPVFDGCRPSEQDLLYNGTYNLGFFAVCASAAAGQLLDWWESRCLNLGFSEGRTGLFVDQKWMNLAPGLFEGIALLRHPGCNMAYWNLHERTITESSRGYLVNTTYPLCFFHFSGVDISDATSLSANTDRFTLASRPDLQPLFADYKAAVIAQQDPVRQALPYGFDILSDGTTITRLARRIYAEHHARFPEANPFAAEGAFAIFAKRLGLVKGKASPKKATWKQFNPSDRRVKAIHRGLTLMLRVLGPHRYDLFMRYLAHIAVLRNQAVFLGNDPSRRI